MGRGSVGGRGSSGESHVSAVSRETSCGRSCAIHLCALSTQVDPSCVNPERWDGRRPPVPETHAPPRPGCAVQGSVARVGREVIEASVQAGSGVGVSYGRDIAARLEQSAPRRSSRAPPEEFRSMWFAEQDPYSHRQHARARSSPRLTLPLTRDPMARPPLGIDGEWMLGRSAPFPWHPPASRSTRACPGAEHGSQQLARQ
jgi:hypothetical protein